MALVFGAIAILVASLAGRRALAAASIVGVFLVTAPVVGVLTVFGGAFRQAGPMLNPVTLVSGVKTYLYHVENGRDLGVYGPMYVAVAVALVIACGTLLVARYQKVDA